MLASSARLESLWVLSHDTEQDRYKRKLKALICESTGGDVWATKDLLSHVDGKLLVRKGTKDTLHPRPKAGPVEQLVVAELRSC